MAEEQTQTVAAPQIGELEDAQAVAAPQSTAPAQPAAPVVDPLLEQYRQSIEDKGETGRLFGQTKEVEIAGKPVILVHPGLRQAMNIAAKAVDGVPLVYDAAYLDPLLKSVVKYPEEISKAGIDYFDEHPDTLLAVVREADTFLNKYLVEG
ncbi:MAG: hypothetical protein ACRC9Z_10495 [Weissella confusa]